MLRRIAIQCAFGILSTTGFFVSAHGVSLARVTAALPNVPDPPQGRAFWVAPSLRMNGLPMTIKGFHSQLRPDDVLAFYERYIGAGPSEHGRFTSGEWRILGIHALHHHVTVQARATIGGSEGTITVSAVPDRVRPAVVTAFPHPKTSRLISRQEYDDDGIESEHLSLSTPRPAAIEAQAFADELQRAGWQVTRHQSLQATPSGAVMEAQRGAQHALLVLQPDRSAPANTVVVVVWRKM